MQCPNCGPVSGIYDENHVWCEGCGQSMKSQVHYVTGYCQSYFSRSQVYCRVKRFGKYISRVTSDPNVLQQYHRILDIYSCFEFAWGRHIGESRRIYFFAKPVMLKMCCSILQIETDSPGLKDKNREREQIAELNTLRLTREFRSMLEIKRGSEIDDDVVSP